MGMVKIEGGDEVREETHRGQNIRCVSGTKRRARLDLGRSFQIRWLPLHMSICLPIRLCASDIPP